MPRREASEEINSTDTLNLYSLAPDYEKIHVYCFSSPVHGPLLQ